MENRIKAIAIDDHAIATGVIGHFCKDIDCIDLQKTFNDAEKGLKFLNKYPVDLVFLDIDMPKINGLELCKKIKQDVMVIFVTTHQELAIEGFNLDAVDYLVKPFTFERFDKAVKKAWELLKFKVNNGEAEKYLFIRADYKLMKIALADIDYIEGLDDYIKIHQPGQKPVVARSTMKTILEKLQPSEFLRIHRSFIVAVKKIDWVKTKVMSVAGRELPVGDTYIKDVEDFLEGKK